ncbi:MAG TPA: hypothetical protein DCP69_12995 [Candidatus Omnitrophica bacterium]|nr:hypothetical protein [Candidatus Omnitrophota bacterium]
MKDYRGLVHTIIKEERKNLEKAMRYWRRLEFHANHPELATLVDPMAMRIDYGINISDCK